MGETRGITQNKRKTKQQHTQKSGSSGVGKIFNGFFFFFFLKIRRVYSKIRNVKWILSSYCPKLSPTWIKKSESAPIRKWALTLKSIILIKVVAMFYWDKKLVGLRVWRRKDYCQLMKTKQLFFFFKFIPIFIPNYWAFKNQLLVHSFQIKIHS